MEELGRENVTRAEAATRRLAQTGRNDPCWCGSGKKYKRCHLAEDEQSARGEAPQPLNAFGRLRRQLADYAMEVIPRTALNGCLREFFGSDQAGDEVEMLPFMDWLIFDWRPTEDAPTIIDRFRSRNRANLSAQINAALEVWAASAVELYEVVSVTRGREVRLRVCETGDELTVHDVSTSESVVRGDYLLSRVVIEEQENAFSAVGLRVPRPMFKPFTEWLGRDRAALGLDRKAHFRRHWPRIHRYLMQLPERQWESLELRNSDGDPFELQKAVFSVSSMEAVIEALRSSEAFVESGEGESFSWLRGEPDEKSRTVLGTVRIGQDTLTFECNSRRRIAQAKKLLNALAGKHLHHAADEITSQTELKRQAASSDARELAGQDQDVSEEVARQAVMQYLERHYASWPDTPLPALKNQTPRQAAQSTAGRAALEEILLDFENRAEHERRDGRPTYDFSKLRRELGLT